MTTKDEQPGREPLLSDEGAKVLAKDAYGMCEVGWEMAEHAAIAVRDFYEDKISEGKLIVKP